MRTSVLGYVVSALLGALLASTPAAAQTFGRNKVQYDDFDFRLFRTEHFEIYYYPEAEQAVQDAARMAERWYHRHGQLFARSFAERKPIILYANDADFHQTNVISGTLGEGTGGVTESLKQRVVMPLTGIYSETDHVLGHELVHSFQYDIGLAHPEQRTDRFNLSLLPLWLIEGTAEYFSMGRRDPHTAMWLRDAALRDDLPTIKQLTNKPYEYFPYRYGQAYMAYVGGKYGDVAVADLFKMGGRTGLDSAFVYTLGITTDSLSQEWIQAVEDAYLPLVAGRTPADSAGRRVLAEDLGAGEINIAPAVSPDGQYVAFLSEKDLFNINLFVADAETGKIVTKLRGAASSQHFDAIRFINSAGTWSPDGKQLAFVTFAEGDNEIAVWDLDSKSIDRRIKVEGVTALSNPAWSPDGAWLAFSGMNGGISDLYLLDVKTNAVRQLTDDRYADLQPAWSPDSRTIAFATDRGPYGTDFETLTTAEMRLGLIDVATGAITVRMPFDYAMHHNPQFSPDGRTLFFISDQDGFKDIYRLTLDTGATTRVTHLQTGVSGITALSPAMSVAAQSGRMLFSVFADGSYTVFALEADELPGEAMPERHRVQRRDSTETVETTSATVASALQSSAGVLPPWSAIGEGLVTSYLTDHLTGLPDSENYASKDYSAKLKLDYIAPPSVGVSLGGFYGTGLYGGIGLYFSDMLGNHSLGVGVQMNGGLKDLGGQVSYFNRKHRFNYGGMVAHIPYRYGGYYTGVATDPETGLTSLSYNELRQRIYLDQAALGGSYALSTTKRIETSVGFVRYGFDYEVISYNADGSRTEENLAAPDPLHLFQAGLAYVVDFSAFGYTSPVRGGRYRFQVTPLVGSERFVSVLADYRRYFFFKPVTLAVRGMHRGNYGAAEEDVFGAEYLGHSYYSGFVRGYNYNSFDVNECSTDTCPEYIRLFGTRIALASAELRIPLMGSDTFGLINFPYLPTELAFFADAGLAWSEESPPVLEFSRDSGERVPVVSVGASTRFNLFNVMVFEVYYAYPFQRPVKGGHFGVQFVPGW